MFHQHPNRRKPDVIYSRKMSLQDVLNASAAQNARSVSNVSINTAQEEIRKCSGITLRPLNVDDVYGRPNVSIFAKFHSLSLKLIRCR